MPMTSRLFRSGIARPDSRQAGDDGERPLLPPQAASQRLTNNEASRVSDSVYTALRPMLATSNGQLIALTTPHGRRGSFYEAWEFQKSWERTIIIARECPRISEEFLADDRESMGERRFRQECCASFVLAKTFTTRLRGGQRNS